MLQRGGKNLLEGPRNALMLGFNSIKVWLINIHIFECCPVSGWKQQIWNKELDSACRILQPAVPHFAMITPWAAMRPNIYLQHKVWLQHHELGAAGLLWAQLCPLQDSYVEVLTPSTWACDLYLKTGSLKKQLSYNEVLRVGPDPIWLVSLKEEGT